MVIFDVTCRRMTSWCYHGTMVSWYYIYNDVQGLTKFYRNFVNGLAFLALQKQVIRP